MQSIRIEPVDGGKKLLVDVVCDCGRNGLEDAATGEPSFKHVIPCNPQATHMPKTILVCRGCGKRYSIVTQGSHIHVAS